MKDNSMVAPDSGSMPRIEMVPIAVLKPHPDNPRKHGKKQIRKLVESIREFGFKSVIVIDRDSTIINGHGRVEAAKIAGLDKLPAMRCEDLTDAQITALRVLDNRLPQMAEWDLLLLGKTFQGLIDQGPKLDFDLTITGFDHAEIDNILEGLKPAKAEEPEAIPQLAEGPAVTRRGDLWAIGPHRLLCGDATDPRDYATLLGDRKANAVFVDPPYNVKIDGHVSGLGKNQHREFVMASGEMSSKEFREFLRKALTNLAASSVDGALNYIAMDWRHEIDVHAASEGVYSKHVNTCVWFKKNAGMGSFYRSQHEFFLVFRVGDAQHQNHVQLGAHGRNRSNVWNYAGMNSFAKGRDEKLASHPTVKPVALVADAIRDCSKRRDIVLDSFAGSGTTLVAAHRTGRRGFGMELDPKYCDLILKRLREEMKVEPVLLPLGDKFSDVARERALEREPAAKCDSDQTPLDEGSR
ncbi:DNA methyltransferase [Enhydrobacter sp.]|uniref:site-specific DNA-methyltransferase n=1 Tax=Enhydrobacter sp. TaxID=1894999 RepID=UPI0026333B77|nr:DNA methyltransferase [Enhydrobacter sp.]